MEPLPTFKISFWPVFLVVAAALLLALHEYALLPDGKLHMYVLDIGQGDSILFVTPSGKQILVDGGPDTSALEHFSKYMPFFDRTIELLVLSHPDADHVTAFPDVLNRYKTEAALINGTVHRSGRYEAFLSLLETQKVPIILSDIEKNIDMGDGVVIDVVWPTRDVFATDPEVSNDLSVTARLLYGDTSILLTGDIEEMAETAILRSGVDVTADIIKVPHHGSRTSSSTGFLLAVNPTSALMSVGFDNKFGHPHKEVVDRYQSLHIPVQITAGSGDLVLEIPNHSLAEATQAP